MQPDSVRLVSWAVAVHLVVFGRTGVNLSLLVMFDEILDLKVGCYVLRVRPSFEGGWDTGNCSSPSNDLAVTPNDLRLFWYFFFLH